MTKSVVATPHQAGIIYTECVKSCRTDTLKEFVDGAYCGPLIQDQNESSIRDTNSWGKKVRFPFTYSNGETYLGEWKTDRISGAWGLHVAGAKFNGDSERQIHGQV